MQDYKWVLIWKYPFLVKRPLTNTEKILKQTMELFNTMPIVIMIDVFYKIKTKLKQKG